MAILVHAGWIVWRMTRSSAQPTAAAAAAAPVRDARWFAAEAGRLAAAGEYARAMQADFLALILELDRKHLLRFHPSKTPGEYASEWRELRSVVRTLYAHLFARVPCGPGEYDAWRRLAAEALHAAPA